MKKLILAVLFSSIAAFGQSSGVGQVWTVVSGTLQSGATANGNGAALGVQGLAAVSVTVNCSVACSGGTTINFEGSQDGTNITALTGQQNGTSTFASTVVNQGTTATVWTVPVAGLQSFRARISAYSAGTITVAATTIAGTPVLTAISANLLAGAATIGAVTQASGPWTTNLTQLAGTAVDVNSGTKSAGTIRVVLATDQPALSNKLLVTPDSVALPAHQSTNVDQLNGTTTDTNSGTKSAGTLRVVLATDQPALTNKLLVTPDANSGVNLSQVGGASTSTSASGVQKVGIVGNAGAAVDAATGAAPPANAVLMAGLGSGATGGFMTAIPVCDTFKNVNISTATTTLIVTGVSGRQVRICHIDLVALAADNVGIISGTGATCGTGSAAIVGTTAATGYNFAANGGISAGSGLGTIMQSVATGDSVCIITSAATQLSGTISYTIF